MRAFAAIMRLTLRHAVRSHIFQLLLGLLLVCVVSLPMTIGGDGTAYGFIQVSLLYSLSAVLLLLALSSIWLGCFMMSHDVDSYQLHMIVSKPVTRFTIWMGKFCGITLLNAVLLTISATVIYFTVLYQFNQAEFSEEERAKIVNEVMVGRRVFMPEQPDLDAMAREEMLEKYKKLEMENQQVDKSPQAQARFLASLKRDIIARLSELKYGGNTQWKYKNLPPDLKVPLYLRSRIYIDKIATSGQRVTAGMWHVAFPQVVEDQKANANESGDKSNYRSIWVQMSDVPETYMSGEFHEKILQPEWKLVAPDGTLELGYTNFDPEGKNQYLQPADGPKVLLKETGFAGNYIRCVAVIFLELVILTGLACAAAGVLTMPTAIFMVVSYLMLGSIATFIVETTSGGSMGDYASFLLGKLILLVVIPIQNFEVTNFVANGELIEFSFIGGLIWSYLLLRALPLFLIGIWLYRKRELGLVIRK